MHTGLKLIQTYEAKQVLNCLICGARIIEGAHAKKINSLPAFKRGLS